MPRTHGLAKHPLYLTWAEMIARCERKSHKRFADYGGRGIKVCPQWRANFAAFLADMGERPQGMTLDRENNDGDYEPGNCRWVSYAEQNLNKRSYRNSSTGVSGIEWDGRSGGRYRVSIRRNGVRTHLGFTTDFFEACCRRKSAEAHLG